MDIKSYGLAKEIPEIKICIRDFLWMKLKGSDFMATLTPEARDAINTIADMTDKARLKDGITQADVDEMVAAAMAIDQLFTHNKLLQ
jgi:hypothetical protein